MAQIDEFIEHAQLHKEKYGDNILVFISKHYGELKTNHEKEHQEDNKDHEQLPFKQLSNLTTTTAFVLNTSKEELKTVEILERKSHHFYYQEPTSSAHTLGLLQPPRQS